ncbi:hypothetical protein OS21_44200 [Dickeya oryzae]
MRILVVEDDGSTGDYLKKGLTEAGYAVDLARNGTDGLFNALEHSYDVIILDVMLPGLNGWQIIEMLRKKKRCTGAVSDGARPVTRPYSRVRAGGPTTT